MENQPFVYSTYIQTTPEKLWEALTNSEFTKQYWGGRTVESDWKEGSTMKMFQPQGAGIVESEGKVLKAEYPKILSYTGIGGNNPDSSVTFEIIQLGANQVRLNITHIGIPADMTKRVTEGWFAIMSSLKTLLETGTALDFSWWKG